MNNTDKHTKLAVIAYAIIEFAVLAFAAYYQYRRQ